MNPAWKLVIRTYSIYFVLGIILFFIHEYFGHENEKNIAESAQTKKLQQIECEIQKVEKLIQEHECDPAKRKK